jgi:hypothetical protein
MKHTPWIPPGSDLYRRKLERQWEDERRDRDRGRRDRWERRGGGRAHHDRYGPRYHNRGDDRSWPQASVNISWGLYGAYGRWRDGRGRGFSDSRIGALFSYVDRNVALKFSGRLNPAPREMEYETLTIINNYVNENVESIAVDGDGNYFVMFRSERGGEGEWVPADVTETDVLETARESRQFGNE